MSEPETPGTPPQLGQYPPGLFPPQPPGRRWSSGAIVALVLVVLGVPARIEQGDCLSKSGLKPLAESDSSEEIEIGRVRLVPCHEVHEVHEVEAYLNGNLSGGSYPGTTEITIQVADRCRREFRTFIGCRCGSPTSTCPTTTR